MTQAHKVDSLRMLLTLFVTGVTLIWGHSKETGARPARLTVGCITQCKNTNPDTKSSSFSTRAQTPMNRQHQSFSWKFITLISIEGSYTFATDSRLTEIVKGRQPAENKAGKSGYLEDIQQETISPSTASMS